MDDAPPNPDIHQQILYEDFLCRCAAMAEAVPMTVIVGEIGELGDDFVDMWHSDDPLKKGEAYLGWRKSMGFSVQETEDGEIVEIPFKEL